MLENRANQKSFIKKIKFTVFCWAIFIAVLGCKLGTHERLIILTLDQVIYVWERALKQIFCWRIASIYPQIFHSSPCLHLFEAIYKNNTLPPLFMLCHFCFFATHTHTTLDKNINSSTISYHLHFYFILVNLTNTEELFLALRIQCDQNKTSL